MPAGIISENNRMPILFVFLSMLWWIGAWGLSDVLTRHWNRSQKITAYSTMMAAVLAVALFFPTVIEHL